MPKDMKLLDNWVQHGLAVYDAGDGAWDWTPEARKRFLYWVLCTLSSKLWGTPIPDFALPDIKKLGFNEEGYYNV